MDVSRSLQLSRHAARRHADLVASGRTSSVPAATGAVTMGAVAVASALAGVGVLAVLTAALGLALLGVVVEDARSAWRYVPRPAKSGRTRDGRTRPAGAAQAQPVVVPHQQDGTPLRTRPAPHEDGVLRPPVPVQRRRVTVQDDQEEFLKVVLLDLVAAGTAWSTVSLSNLLSREEDRVGMLMERLRRQEDEARRREAARKLQELAELRSRLAAAAAAPGGVRPPTPDTDGSGAVGVSSRTQPAGAADVTLDEVEKALSVVVRYLAPTGQAPTLTP